MMNRLRRAWWCFRWALADRFSVFDRKPSGPLRMAVFDLSSDDPMENYTYWVDDPREAGRP